MIFLSAGDRIARSRNLRDMAKFKMLVRRFMKEAVESGMGLKQSHTWNQIRRRTSIENC